MEAAAVSAATVAGPSNEVSTPYEEDVRHGHAHFAITASQVPKPTVSMPPMPTPNHSPEMSVKDLKSSGARFHEDCHDNELPGPRLRSSRMFKGKEPVTVEREKKKPLRLLDLPVDILKDIVKEVTHTNDLTSLALCHSALHRLTTPHIYSRFDIVWPDSSTHAEPRSGVDALTYGLATLVMAEEIFGEAPSQRQQQDQPTNRFSKTGHGRATETSIRRRRGNHYAQFTKKFSLGNGPADWVQEYLITKEGGKMLGTLVAIAVARMRSLETFIWDMPTGILRDVWLALSSLGDRDGGKPCKLEKVWVRWHDNTSAEAVNPVPPPLPLNITPGPLHLQPIGLPTALPQYYAAALTRVEHPSFSVLPPLKSLSVLDIDELTYLDEMAVLIGKSVEKLRELRVGLARHTLTRDWVRVWEGESVQQVDPEHPVAGSLTIGEKRLGGVLGTLTGFVYDMRRPRTSLPDRTRHRRLSSRAQVVDLNSSHSSVPQSQAASPEPLAPHTTGLTSFPDVISEAPGNEPESPGFSPIVGNLPYINNALAVMDGTATSIISGPEPHEVFPPSPTEGEAIPRDFLDDETPPLSNVLGLESLELERIPLSVPVLQKVIDWGRLTSITLLHCPNHEQLWKTLRKQFAPTPKSPTYPSPRRSTNTPKKGKHAAADIELEYKLNLKKIHTNTVSPALITFLKETLAPNSLEVLFLQEARSYTSNVQVDAIFRGPIRRHRGSLKKLMIDSSDKNPDGLHSNSSRWRRWMLNREVLAFICSGKMASLRELGMAIDYRDWHFFLQRLPSVPQLRSLFLPFLADHVHGANVDPRELALQIVDIVALRPEVELCYMGIANKCFEILENGREGEALAEKIVGRLRLREILFYDDKVAIFKARHGRL
ncbi:hypothetical protein AC578_5764 [Lecanosticta acicola]|uniref:F-box domain-containing protein n=1 Tax=Lecanosticta acicola TaxID=111012 RepID=A0AAI8Z1K0_9PEZI|nr:hypothetical protein AC578_5764 [Lecanosticta acicola]